MRWISTEVVGLQCTQLTEMSRYEAALPLSVEAVPIEPAHYTALCYSGSLPCPYSFSIEYVWEVFGTFLIGHRER